MDRGGLPITMLRARESTSRGRRYTATTRHGQRCRSPSSTATSKALGSREPSGPRFAFVKSQGTPPSTCAEHSSTRPWCLRGRSRGRSGAATAAGIGSGTRLLRPGLSAHRRRALQGFTRGHRRRSRRRVACHADPARSPDRPPLTDRQAPAARNRRQRVAART